MANSIRDIPGASTNALIARDEGATVSGRHSNVRRPEPADPVGLDAVTTTLTSLGSVLGAANKAASSLSSFRAGLVAALKTGIASGTYRPNPDGVARRVAAALRGMKS